MTAHASKPAGPAEWVFFHDLGGYWRWEQRRGATTIAESRHGYATREECVADARLHGFSPAPANVSPPERPHGTATP
jgi:hypothetical protein